MLLQPETVPGGSSRCITGGKLEPGLTQCSCGRVEPKDKASHADLKSSTGRRVHPGACAQSSFCCSAEKIPLSFHGNKVFFKWFWVREDSLCHEIAFVRRAAQSSTLGWHGHGRNSSWRVGRAGSHFSPHFGGKARHL